MQSSTRWRLTAATVLLVAVSVWIAAPLLLRSAASLWIVEDVPARATAIVILGGGPEYRPSAAARLYRDGWAPLVLVPRVAPSPLEELGVVSSEEGLTLAALDRLGVPQDAIESYGRDVTSTHDEAQAVKAWARGRTIDRLLIPTDPFHTRRVNWDFEKSLPGVDVRVVPTRAPRYDPGQWWQQEEGLIAFQNEAIKWLYYHVQY